MTTQSFSATKQLRNGVPGSAVMTVIEITDRQWSVSLFEGLKEVTHEHICMIHNYFAGVRREQDRG